MKERSSLALELFSQAIDLAPDERTAFLDRASAGREDLRSWVTELLQEDESNDGLLDRCCELSLADLFIEPEPLASGVRIGGYTVLDVIGSGGMGIVYEAEQRRPRRRVALKVLRFTGRSSGRMSRFLQEAETLARLHHPGIAQVIESGVHATDGGLIPYFTMELIESPRDIVAFAEAEGLDDEVRLELFLSVCDAVHFGHQRGVIHCDLKPSNILVGADGRPKVIDFGIASVADSLEGRPGAREADGGHGFGTLAYLPPERLGPEGASFSDALVDSRADVHALGVILFQLLTRRLPYDLHGRSLHEALEVVRTEQPSALRDVRRDLPRDLEWIVSTALDRDPERRYGAVSELSTDLRHYLRGEPVEAGDPGTAYRLRLFARRHRVLLLSFLAIVSTLVVGLVRARVEARARERALVLALSEQAKAHSVAEFLRGVLGSISPQEEGADVRVIDLLDEAAENIDAELTKDPEAGVVIASVLADAYLRLRDFEHAARLLRLAEESLPSGTAEDDPVAIEVASTRTRWLYLTRRELEALELGVETADRSARSLGPLHATTLRVRGTVAETLLGLRRLDEAEQAYTVFLASLRELHGEDHRALVGPRGGLALTRLYAGIDNREEFESIVELCDELFTPDHWRSWNARYNLALAHHLRGAYDDAVATYRQVLSAIDRRFGHEHPFAASTLLSLGFLQSDMGALEEGLLTLAEMVEVGDEVWGPGNRESLRALVEIARLELALGRADESAALTLHLLEDYAQEIEDFPHVALGTYATRAGALSALGRHAEARQAFLDGFGFGARADLLSLGRFLPAAVEYFEQAGRASEITVLLDGLLRERPGDRDVEELCARLRSTLEE